MKLLRLWLLCILFIIVNGNLIHIPLKPSVSDDKRSSILMALKERLQSRYTPNFVEEGSNLPLDVEILSTKHLATYYGNIQVQGKFFKVLFDTGSCEFWVPSEECKTSRCKKHSRLPKDSKAKIASKNGMSIQYLSGKVQGDMVYETVTLGEIKVDNQVVGVAKDVNIQLLDDVEWDGILGLAYPNPTLTKKHVTPIFDTIIKSGVLTKRHLSNQLAYYISDYKGSVTFGGADCDLISKGGSKAGCIEQFKFVPVTEKTYWTISLKDVQIQYPGKPAQRGFCPPEGCKAIVDTGTYLIYGPENQVTQMVSSSLKSCTDHRQMPTFTFDFHVNAGEAPVSVQLTPEDYILKFEMNNKDDCVVGISPDKDVIWTLGQVFLRSFYTVFDRDEDRIGFARLPRSGFRPLNSKKTMKAAKKREKKEQKKEKKEVAKHPKGFLEKMRALTRRGVKAAALTKLHHTIKKPHRPRRHESFWEKMHDLSKDDSFIESAGDTQINTHDESMHDISSTDNDENVADEEPLPEPLNDDEEENEDESFDDDHSRHQNLKFVPKGFDGLRHVYLEPLQP